MHPDTSKRLSRQCEAILARLQRGPATNRELSALSLKYTARVSDLRERGFNVAVKSHDHRSGLVIYELRQRETPTQVELFG